MGTTTAETATPTDDVLINASAEDLTRIEPARPPDGYEELPERSILWTVLGTNPQPLCLLWGIRWALNNGQQDLTPLSAPERRDLAVLLEFVVDHIEREGL